MISGISSQKHSCGYNAATPPPATTIISLDSFVYKLHCMGWEHPRLNSWLLIPVGTTIGKFQLLNSLECFHEWLLQSSHVWTLGKTGLDQCLNTNEIYCTSSFDSKLLFLLQMSGQQEVIELWTSKVFKELRSSELKSFMEMLLLSQWTWTGIWVLCLILGQAMFHDWCAELAETNKKEDGLQCIPWLLYHFQDLTVFYNQWNTFEVQSVVQYQ